MKLSFAFSPCPNDTFMFEPIVSERIDLHGLEFEISLDEVEVLNTEAFKGRHDITKLSFNAFTKLTDQYQLLTAGSALGRGCGPILVSKDPITVDSLSNKKIAIPGINTTANMLMNIALPHVQNKEVIVFHDIEQAIIDGRVDAGLLIHESRFTYQDHGLSLIMDMGEYWEKETGLPIPLGGIAVRRDLPEEIKRTINRIITNSVSYSFEHPKSGIAYIRCHAQEMDEEVMYNHINLYVNEFSNSLGTSGKSSIRYLFEYLVDQGKLHAIPDDIFVE